MSIELNINDNILLLSELGDQYKGNIINYDDDIVKLKFDTIEEVFFVDKEMRLMFNENGTYNFKKITEDTDGVFKFNIEPTDILTNKTLATSLVWEYIGYTPPNCNCPRCINLQIINLESALQTVPPDNQIANLLALHINEHLLPTLRRLYSTQTNTFRSFLSLLGMDVSSDDQLNELLNSTFNEQEDSRIKSSKTLIDKVKNLIKPYDPNTHKHKTCCLCLEDISNEDDKRLIVLCPCCRTKIKDWFEEI